MKIAIIMPYYNEKDLLVKSVNAIINQSCKDWQLFIIDDGSAMGSRAHEVLTLPKDVESKITFVYKSNGGVSSARNTGIDLVLRDESFYYVAYCDADDVWTDKDYLSCQLSLLDSAPYSPSGECLGWPDMVYAKPDLRFLDGSKAIPFGITDYLSYPGKAKLALGNFIYISGVIHNRKCLEVGYFDYNLNSIEDWDYWVRIAAAGFKIQMNSFTTFTYTVKPDGNGSKSTEEVYKRFREKHKYTHAEP